MLIFCSSAVFGQTGIGINTVNPKSTLDVVSTSANSTQAEGIQGPRLTLAELTAKGNSRYGTAQTGAIIYITNITGVGNTGQRANITATGYYYFDGTLWQKLNTPQSIFSEGDIVQSFRSSDFDGWYILDGRAISSLPQKAQSAAAALGFSTSLPDARDRVLKNKSASESLGATGGSSSIALSQSNLPNINLTGTISGTLAAAGAHRHTASGNLAAGGDHSHVAAGTLAAAGDHTHNISGNLAAGGAHTHTINGTLNSAGNHTHRYYTIYIMPSGRDVDRGYGAGSAWSYLATSTYTTSSSGNHNHTLSTTLAAGGGHTHTITGNLAANGEHAHTLSGTLNASDTHTHNVAANLVSTGTHTHTASGTTTLPLNGSSTAINNRSAYLVVNTFIYLGQ